MEEFDPRKGFSKKRGNGEKEGDPPLIHWGLTTIMILPAIDSNLLLQFTSGILSLTNPAQILITALTCIAGMGSWTQAATLPYKLRTRMRLAVAAGIIATIATMVVAVCSLLLVQLIGPVLWVIKLFGAIAVFLIGLSVAKVKIPELLPPAIAATGFSIAIAYRYFSGFIIHLKMTIDVAIVVTALLVGLIAMSSVILAALVGELIRGIDEDILRVAAGVVVCTIALAVGGLNYPSWILLVWLALGGFLSWYYKKNKIRTLK